MKKKLNLLWNLKFNFFSVAERPLTFFAYFLNAKKVGRRRLVISPAKAGAFLFVHTRLPLSPRRGRRPASAVPPQAKWSRTAASTGFCGAKTEMKSRRCGVAKPRGCNPRPHAPAACRRAISHARRCRDQYAMGAASTGFCGAKTEMKSRR